MKELFSWRSQAVMPMLDEDEWREIDAVMTSQSLSMVEKEREVLRVYFRLTAHKATNANVVFHHRLALYSPPCRNCRVPLRTPRATSCAKCGTKRCI
jgi:hypothetical protein